ncbi:hypothetical protein FGG08_007383 [Glutinoglossum americanum]|uniref:Uncharacterized protein n=1 Tax=Glutinoglossum americanum TaxID=1670608 RepID=A0A9P8KTZ8_9PEZI|nr:hypothetical protein FGG08_007383 [Glutinoglossum americanum]
MSIDSVLDRVRPEVREEALQLQRRLQQLVAEGDDYGKLAGGDEYNNDAPFPFDVRVNNQVVEVLAPVESKDNGKKYQAARKSAARWQPLPPRQVAHLRQANTPSVRKANGDYERHLAHPTPAPLLRPEPGPTIPAPSLRSGRSKSRAPPQRPDKSKRISKGRPQAAPVRRQEQTSAPPQTGAWVRTDKGKISLPGLAEDDEGGVIPRLRRRLHKPPRLIQPEDGGDESGDNGNEGDSGDDSAKAYAPTRHQARSRNAKEPLMTVAQMVADFEASKTSGKRKHSPVLFPASRPPPKLFMPTGELRRGYQAVAEEKEKVHPSFDPVKNNPIDKHLRTINRTTGPSKVGKEKSLLQRVKPLSPIPETLKAPEVPRPPQVPDLDLGEEAYRGRVFRTVEGGNLGLFGGLFGDDDDGDGGGGGGGDGGDGDGGAGVTVNHQSPEEPEKDWRETYLPAYLEEAFQDPFAAFH